MTFNAQLRDLWQAEVNDKYMFRGMSRRYLADPLDPTHDPFIDVRHELYELCDVLELWIAKGLDFMVVEHTLGCTYTNPLGRILEWSRCDLDHPGLDFTSERSSAQGYSVNALGSQLRENFKIITGDLEEHLEQSGFGKHMTPDVSSLFETIRNWSHLEDPRHESIVLWVRRSHDCFDDHTGVSPVGAFDSFRRNIIEALEERQLPLSIESVLGLIPSDNQEFCVRLRAPLPLSGIEKIEIQKA